MKSPATNRAPDMGTCDAAPGAASWRGIVLQESLVGRKLPESCRGLQARRYPHLLSGVTPVEIIELVVPNGIVREIALELSSALETHGFYAHLLDGHRMLVVLPGEVLLVRRGDRATELAAQAAGRKYGIPMAQMRFEDMFEVDHPDAPPTDRAHDKPPVRRSDRSRGSNDHHLSGGGMSTP